jgi:hypothetical protein
VSHKFELFYCSPNTFSGFSSFIDKTALFLVRWLIHWSKLENQNNKRMNVVAVYMRRSAWALAQNNLPDYSSTNIQQKYSQRKMGCPKQHVQNKMSLSKKNYFKRFFFVSAPRRSFWKKKKKNQTIINKVWLKPIHKIGSCDCYWIKSCIGT